MLITYPHTQPDSAKMADFGCFHSTGLQFDDYTASSRGLTAAKRGELHYMRVRHADDARPESFM